MCAHYLSAQGFTGVGGGRFFINGVDTEDQRRRAAAHLSARSRAAAAVGLHARRQLQQDGRHQGADDRAARGAESGAAAVRPCERADLRAGQSEEQVHFAGNWRLRNLAPRCAPRAMARALAGHRHGCHVRRRRGRLQGERCDPAFENPRGPRRPRHAVRPLQAALGAENLFDQYPDANPAAVNGTGTAAFSNYSPFGRSGALPVQPCEHGLLMEPR